MKKIIRNQKFLILIMGIIFGGILGATLHKETIVVREGTADTPAALTSVNLMIDDGSSVHTWNTISWHETMTVLDLLSVVADTKNITLATKDLGKGSTAITINGVSNDTTTGMRWQYWIDNTYEPRIASKYYLKPGDIVVWKFTKDLANK